MKVLGDAPAMPMGNLYWTWAKHIGDVRTQETSTDLFEGILDPPGGKAEKLSGAGELFAGMPAASFNGSDGGEESGSKDGRGEGRGHHAPSEATHGDAGPAVALSLFKSFTHGDLDI